MQMSQYKNVKINKPQYIQTSPTQNYVLFGIGLMERDMATDIELQSNHFVISYLISNSSWSHIIYILLRSSIVVNVRDSFIVTS